MIILGKGYLGQIRSIYKRIFLSPGNQMNIFLNENWEEVLKEFTPAIAETVSQIIYLIVNSIAEKVPYDEIFAKWSSSALPKGVC